MQMLEWIGEIISGALWGGFNNFTSGLLDLTFKFITEVVIKPTNPGEYLGNFNTYLSGVQYFAGGLLIIFVVLAFFRQLSGVMYTTEKSTGTYFLHITFAGGLIFILPIIVTEVLLRINDALIGFIASVGTDTSRMDGAMGTLYGSLTEESTLNFLFLILIISLFILGIAGAIRYIETIIAILVSPLVALSVINNSDGLQIWFREVISIVFTQTIHFLILELLISIIAGVHNLVVMFILAIGTVVVGLRGPHILRQYLYRTGTSSTLVSAAGSTSRIGMMAVILRR